MPFTLPPLSRRTFLAGSLAATATLAARNAWAADEAVADPNRFVLLADTHIPAAPDIKNAGTNMHDNLAQVAKEILELKEKPSAAMILGDLAFNEGKSEDYALLLKLLDPMRGGGLPIHLTMGNHDHRERFWQALPAKDGQDKAIENRHVTVLKTPRANWFILDTLDATNKAPGALGEKQLEWTAKALDEHKDKPALIAMHHNPDFAMRPQGLTDTKKLMEVLAGRKHVKAVFYGHTHVWNQQEREGIHLINLPPVAYVFAKGKPNGFCEVAVGEAGATIKLTAIDKAHAEHGKMLELKWRA